MLLSAALLALFLTGFWLYCLTDAILTPASDCRGLTKPAWLAVIIGTFIAGALAWLIVRQPAFSPFTAVPPLDPDRRDDEDQLRNSPGTDSGDAVARHPAAQASAAGSSSGPVGPDDDPEFLRALGRAIKGNWQAGGETW